MYESVLHEALSLTREQKESLIEALKAAIFSELTVTDDGSPQCCPRCGHTHVVCKGHGRDGSRRWLCRGCGRTFSAKTRSVLALSKLDADTWSKYIEGMVAGEKLRALAKRCGVGLKTSWYMRMRICSVMEGRLAAFRCHKGIAVQLDGKYPAESLTGNRKRARVKMPREPHVNGHGVKKRGLSNERACVLCGVNELGDCFCRLVGRGKATEDEVRAGIAGVDLTGAVVSTDKLNSYETPLEEIEDLKHVRYDSKTAREKLSMVNALHSRLEAFLTPFNGVSTRRIQHYLDWFCWEEQARHSDATRLGMLSSQVARGVTDLRIRAMWDVPQPYFDEYWGGKVWSDIVDVEDLYGPEAMSTVV